MLKDDSYKKIDGLEFKVAGLLELRNNLYDNLPVGEVNSFDLLKIIRNHLDRLDKIIDNNN